MLTSNLDRWKFYMRDICSPDSFIELGYYLIISAALQRRVWYGDDSKALYTNMFAILVGESGVGKGMVTKEIGRVFNHKKMLKRPDLVASRKELEEVTGVPLPSKNKNEKIDNMIIPIAPDNITYEENCSMLAKSSRFMWFPTGKLQANGKVELRPRVHCSILFNLDEMESLFHKDSQKIHTFLNQCYDCGDDYEYRTKHGGSDYIQNPCINLIAGTTPNFLKRAMSSVLVQEGFASRTLFAVESVPRFRRYETPSRDLEQLKAYEELIDHIKLIANIQGPIKWTPEAKEYNKYWYEIEYAIKVPNPHPKLAPYYNRIGQTHAKLAAAIHFGESKSMEIDLEVAKKALKFMQYLEMSMHKAVGIEQKNPLSEVTDNIELYIKGNDKSISAKDLVTAFYHSFPQDPWKDVEKVLQYLTGAGKIMKDSIRPNSYVKVEEKII